jgi:hypothetical protein
MQRGTIRIGVVVCVLALAVAGLSTAQPQGGDRVSVGQSVFAGGPIDPAGLRQMMMDQMKKQLGADDETWKVIEPRLTRVMDLNRQVSAGRGPIGMFGGPMGPGGAGGPVMMKMEQGTPDGGPVMMGKTDRGTPDSDGPQVHVEFGEPVMIKEAGPQGEQTALDKAITQLRTTLDNPSIPPGDIKEQLTAVRIAREKAKRELTDAQADLTKILTVRQEAQLVLMGQLN